MCPVYLEQQVQGTFKLVYTGPNGGVQTYAVEDVNWKAPSNVALRTTGSGKYSIGSPHMITVVEQRMELSLQVGDDPVQHFDSGWVPFAPDSTGGINITISINGMFCWDRVFVIDADRVPPQNIQRYHLSPGSTYHHDCFGICDCILNDIRPMGGDFALVLLSENPLFREFAVVDVRWHAISPSNTEATSLTGVGFYRVGGEVAVQQQMILDLLVTGGAGITERIHFDSGLVAGGAAFPHIDVIVPQKNVYEICMGTILHVVADPTNAQVCGGIAGIPCDPGEFCKLPPGHCCCDFFGVCRPIPEACPEYYSPVCGCDGVTYSNECFADAASVSIDYFGPCEAACRPADDGQGCVPAPCSAVPEEQCIATVLHLDVQTGAITTLACECLDWNFCHIEFGDASPFAVGYCPNGGLCQVIGTDTDGDGIDDLFRAGCESTGACCMDMGGSPLPVPICTEVPRDACPNTGIFLGVGTTCGPVEACCILSPAVPGFCVDISRPCCVAMGGEPQGPGSTCSDLTDPADCSRLCGGPAGETCGAGEFCKFPEGVCSNSTGHLGVCTPIPSGCPDVWDPVCGCDGVTYGNECEADAAAVSILHRGPCDVSCGTPNDPPCANGQFCKFPIGACDATNRAGHCAPIPPTCPRLWDPVCGCDDVTYPNECEADRAGVPIAYYGVCGTNICPAVRHLTGPDVGDFTYCPGVEKSVFIELNPPSGAGAIALEDSPPLGWLITSISHGGAYDAVNHKIKWGPFFQPFPAGVSYAVVPGNDTSGLKCFTGAISVDGNNQPICGDACLEPCCPHIPADKPQPSCADCPISGCGDCDAAVCDDGQVSLCELIGYACAWMRGCNDDLSGMTRAAYIWRNGECYCWSNADQGWFPADCTAPSCCPASTGEAAANAITPTGTATARVSSAGGTRDGKAKTWNVSLQITAPAGTSAVAAEMTAPKGWQIVNISDGGVWDESHRKVKWGPFFDSLSRTVSFDLIGPAKTPPEKPGRLPGTQRLRGLTGAVSFDGINRPVEGVSTR